MITQNLGKISITPKGQWVAGTYERLDLVTNAGSSYLSLKDNNVSELTVTADWMLVAEKGDPFLYTDFTPEQLEALKVKGDKGDTGNVNFDDMTPEQRVQITPEIGLNDNWYINSVDTGKPSRGLQGVQGIQGLKGDTGTQGLKGDTGLQGVQGVKGDKGDTGLQGIQGIQGVKGDTGATGAKGDKGDTGAQGIQGLKGDTGAQGLQGLKGDKGDTGAQGLKGDKGDTGLQGIQGIKGDKGEKGDPLTYADMTEANKADLTQPIYDDLLSLIYAGL